MQSADKALIRAKGESSNGQNADQTLLGCPVVAAEWAPKKTSSTLASCWLLSQPSACFCSSRPLFCSEQETRATTRFRRERHSASGKLFYCTGSAIRLSRCVNDKYSLLLWNNPAEANKCDICVKIAVSPDGVNFNRCIAKPERKAPVQGVPRKQSEMLHVLSRVRKFTSTFK